MGRPRLNDKRICFSCGTDKSVNKRGWRNWRKEDGKWWCKNCHSRIFSAPKWHARRILFKGKRLYVKENPRTGICSLCHRKTGEGIKKTAIHHIQYHEDDLLRDTVELCVSCHDKESWRLGCFDNRGKPPELSRDKLGRFIGRNCMTQSWGSKVHPN